MDVEIIDREYDDKIDGVFETEFEKEYFQTKFKWDSFQLHSFVSIRDGCDVIVCAPTSSGKTSVGKYASIYNLFKEIKDGDNVIENNKVIVYTTPIKSLSNEKYEEMKNILNPLGIEVGLITGDQKINVDARFLIMTAEILCNTLFSKKLELKSKYDLDLNIIDKISCVVMDEIHFISDDDRGHIWENTIIMLNKSVQIVGLSATIDQPETFVNWLSRTRKRKAKLIKKYSRPVPLEFSLFNGEELDVILTDKSKYNGEKFSESIKKYKSYQSELVEKKSNFISAYLNDFILYSIKKDLFQLAFIVFSKKNCERLANLVKYNLNTIKESRYAIKELELKLGKHFKTYRDIPIFVKLCSLIEKGICFHHAGIPVILKEAIEYLYKNGFIKIIFATETIAVGVNMPIRTIVFTALEKKSKQIRMLNGAEFKQISGRAGRRGLDKKGNVVILPLYSLPNQNIIQNDLLFGKNPTITSKLQLNYHNYLKIIQRDDINHREYYKKSLLGNENEFKKEHIKKELKLLDKKKSEINNSISQLDIDHNSYEKYYQLKSYENVGISLNRKQRKNIERLEKIIDNKNRKIYDKLFEITNSISELSFQLDYYENYSDKEYENIIKFLLESEYLIENDKVSIYGKMASTINECNPFILVEIFEGNILHKLTENEIIMLLSIFCHTTNTTCQYDGIVSDAIYYLKDRIKIYHRIEKELGINPSDYFDITTGYIDITKLWVELDLNKEDYGIILSKLNEMNEYEGNFIKNMIKINNIVDNLISLCDIKKNYDILPKLEGLSEKIMKGIVNVESLYVN